MLRCIASRMIAGPKRRRFAFSLRALFVVVAMLACCLAYIRAQYDWLRQRREFLANPKLCVVAEPRPNATAPGLLWAFHEISWAEISLASHSKCPPANASDLARAKQLFPEALIGSKLYGPTQDETIELVYQTRSWQLPTRAD